MDLPGTFWLCVKRRFANELAIEPPENFVVSPAHCPEQIQLPSSKHTKHNGALHLVLDHHTWSRTRNQTCCPDHIRQVKAAPAIQRMGFGVE